MKVLVATVVYNQALEYINDCLESITDQTVSDFDIIIVNDDIERKQLENNSGFFLDILRDRLTVIDTCSTLQIYELRIKMLEYAKQNKYDLVVMIDCDDMCELNRVERYIDEYNSEYTFFYNELVDFDKKQVMPELPVYTDKLDQILKYNYLGMSNTGININKLTDDFIMSLYNGKTSIFDWYLFTKLVLIEGKGKKVKGTLTYYRIHRNNIAQLNIKNESALKKEQMVKIEHYSLLEKENEIFSLLKTKYQRGNYEINKRFPSYWWEMLI